MTILIENVLCTDQRIIQFYQKEVNITLSDSLYPLNGLPVGFIAMESLTDTVVGATIIFAEDIHNQAKMYDPIYNDGNPWLMALVVNETYQNQGIGKQLVDCAITYCHTLNFTQLNLNTETATEFYKKHWILDLVANYTIIDNNQSMQSDMIRLDVQKNIQLNHTKKLKM